MANYSSHFACGFWNIWQQPNIPVLWDGLLRDDETRNANMAYNFGVIAADPNFEIHLLFVTSSEDEAAQLAERFKGSSHRIAVSWIRADYRAIDAVAFIMSSQQTWTPTAIILDYSSFGPALWNIIAAVRQAVGDRYVEYVIFDVPESEINRCDMRAANITMVPDPSQHTGL